MVNHDDGNKRNPHVSNLEWETYRGNTRHAVETGLIKADAVIATHCETGETIEFASINRVLHQ
jgi:hypothetical protein